MAVLNPIKVVITNYPEGQVEMMEAINNPEDESAGTAKFHSVAKFILKKMILWKFPQRNFSDFHQEMKFVSDMLISSPVQML